jgi:two-component system response regulator RstA
MIENVSNKILIVDDDIELCELIRSYLTSNGYLVDVVHRGEQVEQAIESFSPHAIILDLMLPDIDGLSVCKNIRARFQGAIIMLTALGDDIDEVTGLEVGADDYLAKPVKPRVLLAHLRAQMRRFSQVRASAVDAPIFCHERNISIDASKRKVINQGIDVSLSSAEFDLLWLLAEQVGQIVKRDVLHEKIFRLPYDGIDRSIDLRISRVRKKLNDNSKEPEIIKTVRNVGYLLTL